MGTLHYAFIQREYPPNEHRRTVLWDTVATFEFNKDYELWIWLHEQKKPSLEFLPRDISESLSSDDRDNYHWQVFDEMDIQTMPKFEYRKGGEPSDRFEALLAAFEVLQGPKRILICQDQ